VCSHHLEYLLAQPSLAVSGAPDRAGSIAAIVCRNVMALDFQAQPATVSP